MPIFMGESALTPRSLTAFQRMKNRLLGATLLLSNISSVTTLLGYGPSLSHYLLINGAVIAAVVIYERPAPLIELWQHHKKLIWFGLSASSAILCVVTTVLVPNPAQALILDATKTALQSCFPDAATLVGFLIGVIRMIIMVYLVVSMVGGAFQLSRGENVIPIFLPMVGVIVVIAIVAFSETLIITGTTC